MKIWVVVWEGEDPDSGVWICDDFVSHHMTEEGAMKCAEAFRKRQAESKYRPYGASTYSVREIDLLD